jgi:hypothetical protein
MNARNLFTAIYRSVAARRTYKYVLPRSENGCRQKMEPLTLGQTQGKASGETESGETESGAVWKAEKT